MKIGSFGRKYMDAKRTLASGKTDIFYSPKFAANMEKYLSETPPNQRIGNPAYQNALVTASCIKTLEEVTSPRDGDKHVPGSDGEFTRMVLDTDKVKGAFSTLISLGHGMSRCVSALARRYKDILKQEDTSKGEVFDDVLKFLNDKGAKGEMIPYWQHDVENLVA
jgi:hypothetical protein